MMYHTNKSALFSEKEKKILKTESSSQSQRKLPNSNLDAKRDRKLRIKSVKDWLLNKA